ncbi:hypothetical protein FSP39_004581 [Pinctada imbricata]|uniref:Uncharacterized protein n=1 Tax=Pinctada imbricata TaxID=66713 RepID=A0AA88YAB6_PINIB|nr:hypothetical protein FSP39_004581 [Pinctada imbricata]
MLSEIRWRWGGGSDHRNQIMTDTFLGSRSGSAVWQDRRKYVWAFGGQVYNPTSKKFEVKNDLWRFDLKKLWAKHSMQTGWELMHPGSSDLDISINNTMRAPVPRQLATACGIPEKIIIVYGGAGKDAVPLGDTWAFYIPEKRWYPLSEMVKKFHNESIGTEPPRRGGQATWCMQNKFYIFSGANENDNLLRDMWMFDMVGLKWSQTKTSAKISNNQISSSLVTMPHGRSGAATWVGFDNALYIFSGNHKNGNFRNKHLNYGFSTDFWEYNITIDSWKFLMGDQEKCLHGVYGKMMHPNEKNIPGCRRGAAAWTDTMGNLWMFGGDGASVDPASISDTLPSSTLADLWHYDLDRKVWYWMGGSDKGNDAGNYKNAGRKYTTGIYPSSRTEAIIFRLWNEFYIYGGVGHDSTQAFGLLSDLWGIDAHTKVMYPNTAYPGTIFMIIFSAMCLVLIIIVTFMYTRKFFKSAERRSALSEMEYSRLSTEVD